MFELFSRDKVVGFFRGFCEGGLEFHADLALPYQTYFNSVPMHGQFILVQLESENEAVLGRVSSLSSEGRLTGSSGERFTMRAIREDRQIDEQLREDFLTYRVNIRMLGVVRAEEDGIKFVPSHRRLPHVGSQVAFLSDQVLQEIGGHNQPGVSIGNLAFGEYVYAESDPNVDVKDWMQIRGPIVAPKFPVSNLVSRRTFVFARAGFGKSNLNKLLFSTLYQSTPTVTKRGGREVPVGTLLFDPEGEYYWPDDKDRPGLCDVPWLKDKLVVFTSKSPPSPYYGSFIAGGIKIDVRRMRPSDIIALTLPEEKHDQQNVAKIRGLDQGRWSELVDLIDDHGNGADLDRIKDLLRLESAQDFEALAARANMTRIVQMLHDRSSQLIDLLLKALSDGKLCIVDVSQLRGGPALSLSSLILRRIFDRNQEEFTKAEPKTIPTIAVVEEAQTVLNDKSAACRPFIEWVKEGRKYDLGAVLITQQPGSIGKEILSQGDNWFVFHLLSDNDLRNVKSANAHFSNDLLSALLNEPIPGQGVFWSSVEGKPYPIPLRVSSFERLHSQLDKNYDLPAIKTYASDLRNQFASQVQSVQKSLGGNGEIVAMPVGTEAINANDETRCDPLQLYKSQAIKELSQSQEFLNGLNGNGFPWGGVVGILERALPDVIEDRNSVAYGLVVDAVTTIAGEKGRDWDAERRQTSTGKKTTMIFRLKRSP